MPAISLATAQAQLQAWLDADAAVATGQSYIMHGRSLTRANASEITQKIQYWEQRVNQLSRGGGIRVRYGVSEN